MIGGEGDWPDDGGVAATTGKSDSRMILRRTFIGGIVVGLLVASIIAEAQQTDMRRRIGWLSLSSHAGNADLVEGFEEMLRTLGYVEGKNLVLEYRFAEGRVDRLRSLAAELIRLKTDVLVTPGTQATLEAKQLAGEIPIVMVTVADPVRTGVVASLAKPGGNVTGSSATYADLAAKALELLREAAPKAVRIGYLDNLDNPAARAYADQLIAGAKTLHVPLYAYSVTKPDEIEPQLAAMAKARVDAMLVGADAVMRTRRAQIVNYAARAHLPAIYNSKDYVNDGGLMSYGPSRQHMGRQAAVYVDKILKGAKPGDLPVEQPTRFELGINLKTAKALGLTIPPSLLLRADQVVE